MTKKLSYIIVAFRLKTLPAVLGPLAIAIAISSIDFFNFIKILLIISIGISLQILVNLINDFEDFLKGVDNNQRLGPTRATQSGGLSVGEMKLLISIVFLISLFLGFIAFLSSGIFVIFFGILLFILAYSYTGGPLPYGYLGLGELAVLVVFGPFTVLGSLYLFDIKPSIMIFLISILPGLSASLIILVNNIRDIQNDKINKKNTIAVKLGESKSRFLYLYILIAISILMLIIAISLKNILFILLSILVLYIFPISDIGFKRFIVVGFKHDLTKSLKLSELNFTLIKTVKAHFIICLLISFSLVSWKYIAPIFGLSEWIINIL